MDSAEDFGTKWQLFWSFVTMKLLSHKLKAATSGRAAARRDDTLGSLGFGGRGGVGESDSQQPAALGLSRLWWLRGIEMELVFQSNGAAHRN